MGVGFITGRMDCDRSEKLLDLCFEEARYNDSKPIYILVPEKFTYEMEKKLSERLLVEDDKFFRIRVVSFSTLKNIVFTNVGGIKERKIDNSARLMLLYKVMEEYSSKANIFKVGNNSLGITKKISDMIIELKQNNLDGDFLMERLDGIDDKILKYKLSDLSNIFKNYDKLLKGRYMDSEDELEFFNRRLQEYEDIDNATILVDEFTGFTPNQYKIIENLIRKSKNMYFSLLTDLRNFNNPRGAFFKANTTFLKINELCLKNGIKRLDDINLSSCGFYASDEISHLEKEINNYNPKVWEKNVEDIFLNEFENKNSEVEFLAGEIIRLVRDEGYRYSDITVACRDLDLYSYLVNAIFSDYEIEYFLDDKISAKENPVISLIQSILEMKNNRYMSSFVLDYLKNELVDIDDDEVFLLENFILENGISGKKLFYDWKFSVSHSVEEDGEDIEDAKLSRVKEINEIRRRAMDNIQKLDEKLSGRNSARDIATCLYEFAKDTKLDKKIEKIVEGFKEKEDFYKAREYSQVWNIFVGILDQIVEFLGDEKISLKRFINLLDIEFEGYEVGIIPPSRDQISITSIDRMKNPNTKVSFILGINDGVFPKNIGEDSILTDSERESLSKSGLRFDSNYMSKVFDEDFLVYKSLCIASEKLYLSYPVSDFQGNSMPPSTLVKKIKRMFPKISSSMSEGVSSKQKLFEIMQKNIVNNFCGKIQGENRINKVEKIQEDDENYQLKKIQNKATRIKEKEAKIEYNQNDEIYWKLVYKYFLRQEDFSRKMGMIKKAKNIGYYPERIEKNIAEKIYPSGDISVSRLESFSRCPFSYFLNYGIRAEKRSVLEFSPMDFGNYFHKVVEMFSKNIEEKKINWKDVDKTYIIREVDMIGKKISESRDDYILNSSDKLKNIMSRLNNIAIDTLDATVKQIARGDFRPESFELSFGKNSDLKPISFSLDDGRMINLRGKIDRVDLLKEGGESYISIVDYKSSKNSLDFNKIYAGIQLQLFIYMRAAQNIDLKIRPSAMFYSSFDTPVLKLISSKDYNNIEVESHDENLLKESKLSGIVIGEKDIAMRLDSTLKAGIKSNIIPVGLKKNEDFDQFSKVISEDEYKVVSDFVISKAREISESIYSGDIEVNPAFYDNTKPCDFCDYKNICQFDSKGSNNRYRNIKKISTRTKFDEVISKMRKEGGRELDD